MVGNRTPLHLRLTAVLYREGMEWVARCIELDILTSNQDREKAWSGIQLLCVAQVKYAMEFDPEFKHLFRPASAELTQKMATAREEGSPVVLQVDQVSELTLRRLAA